VNRHGFEFGTHTDLQGGAAVAAETPPQRGTVPYALRIVGFGEARPNICLHPEVVTHYRYMRPDGVVLSTWTAGPMELGNGVPVIRYEFARPYDLWASEWGGEKPSTLLYRVQDGPDGAIDVIRGDELTG
jgi:hypothetical protein